MKAKRVLVPLDGSRLAEAALPFAVDLARDADASLVLLRVVEAATSEPSSVRLDATREAERYLDDVAGRAHAEGARQVIRSLWGGSPGHAIVAAAEHHGVDIIVMTTHGRTGLQRECFGSVAESVLRGASRPVLVVRSDHATCEMPPGQAAPLSVRVDAA
jgi:nucleotide-binding universal stress UspA family protein